jgi:MFS family permease
VIISRFVLARVASRFEARLIIASALLGLGYGLALPSVQAQAVNVSEEPVRPRVLPIAGLLFQAAILGFPLVAGWLIAGRGYPALFAVLFSFALAQTVVGWWRYSAARKRPDTIAGAPPA